MKKDEYVAKTEEFKKKHGAKADKVSLKKDSKGYYCHTHRARSKSYRSIMSIPESAVAFISTTG